MVIVEGSDRAAGLRQDLIESPLGSQSSEDRIARGSKCNQVGMSGGGEDLAATVAGPDLGFRKALLKRVFGEESAQLLFSLVGLRLLCERVFMIVRHHMQ